MEEGLIWASLIGGLFGILGLLILNFFWFRKETFKFNLDFKKKEADLNFKKMRKDLGLDSKSIPPNFSPPAASPLDNIGPLLNIAKNLNPDQLSAIADILGGQPEESEGGGIAGLLDNPLVKQFLSGMAKGAAQKPPTDEGGFI